jgi:hypothetical protein
MNLETFVIPEAEAAVKLAEYEAQLAAERTAEDRAITMAYRCAARGLPVISLPRTIARGGFRDDGLPRLAVVRADAAECFVRWDGSDLVYADRDDPRANRGALVGAVSVRVPVPGGDLPARRVSRYGQAARAVVPLIPPAHRPRLRRLRHRHILWEADWTPVPPRDPALLQHIRGDLWAVLAVWDLTDLERHVLSAR